MLFHYPPHVYVCLLWYLEYEKSVTGNNAFCKSTVLRPMDNETELHAIADTNINISKQMCGWYRFASRTQHALHNYCILIIPSRFSLAGNVSGNLLNSKFFLRGCGPQQRCFGFIKPIWPLTSTTSTQCNSTNHIAGFPITWLQPLGW